MTDGDYDDRPEKATSLIPRVVVASAVALSSCRFSCCLVGGRTDIVTHTPASTQVLLWACSRFRRHC